MNGGRQVCCKQMSGSFPIRSPFSKILSLGFYDGTTCGVAQCVQCLEAYRYELAAWDPGQDVRIYSIAPLPRESFEALVRILSVAGEPRWPFWSPTVPSRQNLVNKINAELSKATEPTHVIASRRFESEILAGKEISDLERARLPKHEVYPGPEYWGFWRAFMALEGK